MNKLFLFTLLVLLNLKGISQEIKPLSNKYQNTYKKLNEIAIENEENGKKWGETGNLRIHEDEKLKTLLSIDKENLKKEKGFDGFRVQIFFSSGNNSKKAVNDTKAQFLKLFPDVPTYIVYHSPNFKLRVGNFRTRFEAYAFYEKVRKDFPSAFVVNDKIEFIKN